MENEGEGNFVGRFFSGLMKEIRIEGPFDGSTVLVSGRTGRLVGWAPSSYHNSPRFPPEITTCAVLNGRI